MIPANATTKPTIEPLWGVQDVAHYLGVPMMTVYHWRCSGYGPRGTKVGRYVRYRPDEVRAWFEAQSEKVG
jgi:predicted DNA-binding transcriptional regulator AlpA